MLPSLTNHYIFFLEVASSQEGAKILLFIVYLSTNIIFSIAYALFQNYHSNLDINAVIYCYSDLPSHVALQFIQV